MKTYSREDIEHAFEALPESIRSSVSALEIGKKIVLVANEANLHIDEAEVLNNEVVYLAIGLTQPNEFGDRLREALGITKEKASSLVLTVNKNILLPIRESLVTGSYEEKEDSNPIKDTLRDPIHPSKDEILAGIEDKPKPVQKPTPQLSLAEKKMNETVTIEAQKAILKEPEQKKYPVDPYREPVN